MANGTKTINVEVEGQVIPAVLVKAGAKNTRVKTQHGEILVPNNKIVTETHPVNVVTTSVEKPAPKPAKKSDSLEDMLSGAKKAAPGKSSNAFELDPAEIPGLEETCKKFIVAKHDMDEAKTRVDELGGNIKSAVTPYRSDKLEQGEFATSVNIPIDDRKVQVTFRNQFSPLRAEEGQSIEELEDQISGVVGGEENFKKLFKRARTLTIKKNISDDDTKLQELVKKLSAAGITIKDFFDYTVQIETKPDFDRDQHELLGKGQRKALNQRMGVSQTISASVR